MILTTVFSYSMNTANAANEIETIQMPISIYDHLNDGLLFEYPLDGTLGQSLSMYEGSWNELYNSDEQLIETTLSDHGTPVYTRKTVEQVAEIVKKLIEDQNYKGNNIITVDNGDGTTTTKYNPVYAYIYEQVTKTSIHDSYKNKVQLLPANQEDYKEETNNVKFEDNTDWTFIDGDGQPVKVNDESHLVWQRSG